MIERSEVQRGDVIEVPRGVEFASSAAYRFRVDAVSDWGVTGVKVRKDGEVIWLRGGTIETGAMWSHLERATLHKAVKS